MARAINSATNALKITSPFRWQLIWSAETQRIEYLTIGIAADFHKKPAAFSLPKNRKEASVKWQFFG
jgi:hypothetical protein